jgi:hypothetical protein
VLGLQSASWKGLGTLNSRNVATLTSPLKGHGQYTPATADVHLVMGLLYRLRTKQYRVRYLTIVVPVVDFGPGTSNAVMFRGKNLWHTTLFCAARHDVRLRILQVLTLCSRSSSKCYLRIQSVPQTETTLHHYKDQLVNAV